MMNDPGLTRWDERYAQKAYLFGEQPNAFLARQRHRLQSRVRALAVADGEGRNGVWLAEQGLEVVSVDGSPVAQLKARRLAKRRGVELTLELADLSTWTWPEQAFDAVAGIFIQFAGRTYAGGCSTACARPCAPEVCSCWKATGRNSLPTVRVGLLTSTTSTPSLSPGGVRGHANSGAFHLRRRPI